MTNTQLTLFYLGAAGGFIGTIAARFAYDLWKYFRK